MDLPQPSVSREMSIPVKRSRVPAPTRLSSLSKKRKLSEPAKREVQIGEHRVEIDYLLGKGGYSQVYSVRDKFLRKSFAMKVVDLNGIKETEVKKNLLDEVRLLQDLVGVDRVVQMVACKVSNFEAVMLLEQASSDLSQILIDNGRSSDQVDINFVRYWGGEVLRCVSAVHEHNIVHSDLKPQNFLVVRGALKLCDFGIANKMPTNGTSVVRETRIGTCCYMAPETHKEHQLQRNVIGQLVKPKRTSLDRLSSQPKQPRVLQKSSFRNFQIKRRSQQTVEQPSSFDESMHHSTLDANTTIYKVSKASDVWSCGVILYEMVYKRNPIQRFLETHTYDDLEYMSEMEYPKEAYGGTPVPLALYEVIKGCMIVDPQHRMTAFDAANSLFFQPVAVDLEAVHSVMRSAVKYGHELGQKGMELHLESAKFAERCLQMYEKLEKLSNGRTSRAMRATR